ncbi:MAG: hypothetical protein N2747_01390 [Chitinophagaceae bacterium]|nr:hypothetical protein [Chitinophagaceae bacterium]
MNKPSLLLFIFFIISLPFFAQKKDTTGRGSVDIISAFKPVLRQTAKINFSASPAPADTSRLKFNYDVPNQNLTFSFQPGTLKPLALDIDTGGKFHNSSFVKAGYGNLKTPFVQASISLGNGSTAGMNVYARHISSEGKRKFQHFSNTDFSLKGYFKTLNQTLWTASAGLKQEKYYKYGFIPATLQFPDDSVKQRFQTISARVGFRNTKKNEIGISYHPEFIADIFSDKNGNSESNAKLNVPVQKSAGEAFAIRVGLHLDFTRFSPDKKPVINNNIFSLSPSFIYETEKASVQAGIRPTWDNKNFKLFPNVLAEFSTKDDRFVFQLGWTGYARKTNYMYLASQNPWLWAPASLKNTLIEERYAGFKGTAGNHFTYGLKVAYNILNNQPLFVNDTTAALGFKSFRVVNESRINVLNWGSEFVYTLQEKFSISANLQVNQFSGLKDNLKAWGLFPLEFKTSMRLLLLRDFWFKTDVFGWSAPFYRKKDGSAAKTEGVMDLSSGFEFRVHRNVSVWAQFNNLLNREYQRWNQYPVYGFNFLGGVVFSFDQKAP